MERVVVNCITPPTLKKKSGLNTKKSDRFSQAQTERKLLFLQCFSDSQPVILYAAYDVHTLRCFDRFLVRRRSEKQKTEQNGLVSGDHAGSLVPFPAAVYDSLKAFFMMVLKSGTSKKTDARNE